MRARTRQRGASSGVRPSPWSSSSTTTAASTTAGLSSAIAFFSLLPIFVGAVVYPPCPVCEFEGQSVDPDLSVPVEGGGELNCLDLDVAGKAGSFTPVQCATIQIQSIREQCGCAFESCVICPEDQFVDPDIVLEDPNDYRSTCGELEAAALAGEFGETDCLNLQSDTIRDACACQYAPCPICIEGDALNPNIVLQDSSGQRFTCGELEATALGGTYSPADCASVQTEDVRSACQCKEIIPTASPSRMPSAVPTIMPAVPTLRPTRQVFESCDFCPPGMVVSEAGKDVMISGIGIEATCGRLEERARNGVYDRQTCKAIQTPAAQDQCMCESTTDPPTQSPVREPVTFCSSLVCTEYGTMQQLQAAIDEFDYGIICMCAGISLVMATDGCEGTANDTVVIPEGKSIRMECDSSSTLTSQGAPETCILGCPNTLIKVSSGSSLQIFGNAITTLGSFTGSEEPRIHVEPNAALTLSTLTIAHSDGNRRGRELQSNGNGAAIFNEGSMTALEVKFEDLQSVANGGAVYSTGEATFKECEFTNNKAAGGTGGAIYSADGSKLVVRECTFSNNVDNAGSRNDISVSSGAEDDAPVVEGCANTDLVGGSGVPSSLTAACDVQSAATTAAFAAATSLLGVGLTTLLFAAAGEL